MTSSTLATGYGPRPPVSSTATRNVLRHPHLFFDGDSVNYKLWETKFLSYLYTKDSDFYDVATAKTSPGPTDKPNRSVYAELVQVLDDKS